MEEKIKVIDLGFHAYFEDHAYNATDLTKRINKNCPTGYKYKDTISFNVRWNSHYSSYEVTWLVTYEMI